MTERISNEALLDEIQRLQSNFQASLLGVEVRALRALLAYHQARTFFPSLAAQPARPKTCAELFQNMEGRCIDCGGATAFGRKRCFECRRTRTPKHREHK